MTKKEQETTVKQLEALMAEKSHKRSELNYEITQIRETIEMVKYVNVKSK